jgi:AcrR family transcriptional regulator
MTSALKSAGKVRGDIRREQIVRAALKVIADRGVSGLTTLSIAREAGISEANLYRHFKNKKEISLAAVSQVREIIGRNLDKALEGSSEPLSILKSFFSLQTQLIEQNSGILRLLFSEELHVHRQIRENILKTMYAVSEKLASLVIDGQRAGVIRKDIDALTMVLMFVAMTQGLAFRWSLSGFSFSLSGEGAKLWKNFEKCIIVDEPSTRRRT